MGFGQLMIFGRFLRRGWRRVRARARAQVARFRSGMTAGGVRGGAVPNGLGIGTGTGVGGGGCRVVRKLVRMRVMVALWNKRKKMRN